MSIISSYMVRNSAKNLGTKFTSGDIVNDIIKNYNIDDKEENRRAISIRVSTTLSQMKNRGETLSVGYTQKECGCKPQLAHNYNFEFYNYKKQNAIKTKNLTTTQSLFLNCIKNNYTIGEKFHSYIIIEKLNREKSTYNYEVFGNLYNKGFLDRHDRGVYSLIEKNDIVEKDISNKIDDTININNKMINEKYFSGINAICKKYGIQNVIKYNIKYTTGKERIEKKDNTVTIYQNLPGDLDKVVLKGEYSDNTVELLIITYELFPNKVDRSFINEKIKTKLTEEEYEDYVLFLGDKISSVYNVDN